jgi:hypothetical protein
MQAGRVLVEPPMRATSAVRKAGSITATTFALGGGGSPKLGRRR